MGWSARHSALGVALLTGATACTPPPSDADTAIRAALAGWTADFNAGRAERVCDLFATDLRFDFRGVPERGYPEMCEQLHTTLADPTRRFTYGFRVKDVRVSGELATVRLTWTVSVLRAGASEPERSTEQGLDVFQRQPDGSWKIVRYLAYDEEG